MTVMHYCFLTIVAYIAGTIDTIAGGGGLMTVPALLFVGFGPVTALGTSKLQAAIAELTASYKFIKRKEVSLAHLGRGILFTLIGACLGSILLQFVPAKPLKIIVPCLLAIIFIYYLIPKSIFKKKQEPLSKITFFTYFGLIVGFYNGFFGPGTGSIWMVLISSLLLLPIYQATMLTKPLNFVGNISALVWLLLGGKVNIPTALIMGIGSLLGGLTGAHFVQAKNNQYIKWTFNITLMLCVLSTFYDVLFCK